MTPNIVRGGGGGEGEINLFMEQLQSVPKILARIEYHHKHISPAPFTNATR